VQADIELDQSIGMGKMILVIELAEAFTFIA